MSEEEVNAAAYEGEKGYHGTPSGIDNTAATYGGVIHFERTADGPSIFRQLTMAEPVEIVFASTGITSSTMKVVGDVKARKEASPEWYDNLAKRYQEVFHEANAALAAGDWATLGEAMGKNHAVCQELSVSCEELDTLVQVAQEAGAVGAKMSGTGRGGLMLALTPGTDLQDKVAAALVASGKAPQVCTPTLSIAIGSSLSHRGIFLAGVEDADRAGREGGGQNVAPRCPCACRKYFNKPRRATRQ